MCSVFDFPFGLIFSHCECIFETVADVWCWCRLWWRFRGPRRRRRMNYSFLKMNNFCDNFKNLWEWCARVGTISANFDILLGVIIYLNFLINIAKFRQKIIKISQKKCKIRRKKSEINSTHFFIREKMLTIFD